MELRAFALDVVVAEIAIALVCSPPGVAAAQLGENAIGGFGYRPEHATAASYSLPKKQYATQSGVNSFNNELVRRLGQLPG